MRISNIRSADGLVRNPASPPGGFSLLEIMVVAALIALLAAVAVPMLSGGGGASALQRQAERLSALLEQLNEQSLFVGELLAARLEPGGVRPLRFSHEESAFVAMKGRAGGLSSLELPRGIRLEWKLEQAERRGANLRDALGTQLASNEDGTGISRNSENREKNGTRSEQESASGEKLPQVFFFPSGEVTPLTLWLRTTGAESTRIELELNSLGRVTRPAAGADTDAG